MPFDKLRSEREERERKQREAEAARLREQLQAAEKEERERAKKKELVANYVRLSGIEELIAELYDAIGSNELYRKSDWTSEFPNRLYFDGQHKGRHIEVYLKEEGTFRISGYGYQKIIPHYEWSKYPQVLSEAMETAYQSPYYEREIEDPYEYDNPYLSDWFG